MMKVVFLGRIDISRSRSGPGSSDDEATVSFTNLLRLSSMHVLRGRKGQSCNWYNLNRSGTHDLVA